jgi:hypothetical protein
LLFLGVLPYREITKPNKVHGIKFGILNSERGIIEYGKSLLPNPAFSGRQPQTEAKE